MKTGGLSCFFVDRAPAGEPMAGGLILEYQKSAPGHCLSRLKHRSCAKKTAGLHLMGYKTWARYFFRAKPQLMVANRDGELSALSESHQGHLDYIRKTPNKRYCRSGECRGGRFLVPQYEASRHSLLRRITGHTTNPDF